MAKYYLCEANSPDDGVEKVTPYNTSEAALSAANKSKAKVHFISTINPLEEQNNSNEIPH
jgi:hypothetical protein